jgi:hypothetical protein
VAGGIEDAAEGVGGYQAWSEGLQEVFVNARHEVHGAVMTLRRGSIVRTEAFTDPAKALEAAGVSN